MNKYLVPIIGFAGVITMATLLIGVIILRSPDTRANLWNEIKPNYDRTQIAVVGVKNAFELPRDAATGGNGSPVAIATDMDPGRQIFLGAGCSTCHGIDARGGVVGPSLAGTIPEAVEKVVRNGRGGMPSFDEHLLGKVEMQQLTDYLKGLKIAKPSEAELAILNKVSHEPTVSRETLLRGKDAMRKSCAGCHTPPTKEEMRGGFDVGPLLVEMVRETNLSFDDAMLIGKYILAIREGIDPVALR